MGWPKGKLRPASTRAKMSEASKRAWNHYCCLCGVKRAPRRPMQLLEGDWYCLDLDGCDLRAVGAA